jgi:uncharacterized protein
MKLIVYARVPELGKVKTRLAASLGEPMALQVYRQLLEQVLRQMSPATDVAKELCMAGVDLDGECADLSRRYGLSLGRQTSGDLGDRMGESFRIALQHHARVVLIGSDCPLLDEARIRWAFAELERHPVVFVPVEDGGYSLIGLSRWIPELFAEVAWSTNTVMSVSREKLRQLGVSWSESEVLWDIDEPADWARWQKISGFASEHNQSENNPSERLGLGGLKKRR